MISQSTEGKLEYIFVSIPDFKYNNLKNHPPIKSNTQREGLNV